MNHILRTLQTDSVADFCRRWGIVELAVFGSALRDDFSEESDVDLLLTFAEPSLGTLYDYVLMKEEIETILDRKVDLISRHALERGRNAVRRREIEQTAQTVFAESVKIYA
jgi:predicted nucleotidyltransferase